MVSKWSLDENLFWKETFDELNGFIVFWKKKSEIILSDKRKQQLSAIP